MASDIAKLAKKEPEKVLLPNDFNEHVHPEILFVDMFFNGGSDGTLSMSEDAVNSVMDEATKFSPATEKIGLQMVHEACEKSARSSVCLERPYH